MVTDYKRQCGYDIGSLKDYIYLIPYSADVFSYSIDSGNCSEVAINSSSGIIRINGFNATLKNTESISGRIKYDSEVSIYIRETLGQNFFDKMKYLIQNRWFVIVEDLKGIQYIQSVEFYSEFSYSLSITDATNAQNHIQLTFKGSSNFPTMIMQSYISKDVTTALISDMCSFIKGGAKDLRMCENSYVAIFQSNNLVSNIKVSGGYKFRTIDFSPKTFTYSQSYSNGQFEDTITFSVPLSDYKYYWHYNLVEFSNNRYVVTFRTADDNLYVVGYSDGMTVTYTIETFTTQATLNKITITLKYVGSEGLLVSTNSDENTFETDDSYHYGPANYTVNGISTKECQSNGKAYIILIQKYNSNGVGLNEYMVLEGYEDRFPTLNIIGSYSLTDDFGFPLEIDYAECNNVGDCDTTSGIRNPYVISSKDTTKTFTFTTSCNYELSGVPDWLNVSSNSSLFTMTLGSSLPTSSTTATFYITTSDGTKYPIIVNYIQSTDVTGWNISPRTVYIDHNQQNVTFNYSGVTDLNLQISSSTVSSTYKSSGKLIASVNANYTMQQKTYTIVVNNLDTNEEVTLTIIQSPLQEDWRTVGGYYCENGNKYTRLELYTNNVATGLYKEGTLIEENSSDCTVTYDRWVDSGETVCDGVNEYKVMKRQVSDDGNTWTDTGETVTGELVESNSEKCNSNHVKWVNSGNTQCNGGYLCEVWVKYIDDVATDETKLMNCVEDSDNCNTTYPTKWVLTEKTQCVDRGNEICDSYYLQEQYISYDNGDTWEGTGVYQVSSTMAVKDDEACNCDNHDAYKYERWVVLNKAEYLCDDEEYNCTMNAIWIPNGFYIKDRSGLSLDPYVLGYWETKTITSIKAPCDFDTLTKIDKFAQNCSNLTSCEELDGTNLTSIIYAFDGCSSLTKNPLINLKNVEVANYAFRGTTNMTGDYSIAMPNLINMGYMFQNSGITGWDFGGAKLRWAPVNPISGSKIKSIKGIDYVNISSVDGNRWANNYLETLEIDNIHCDFILAGSDKLSKESLEYMYNHASSSVNMTWYYSQAQKNRWGTLPSTKSNITFKLYGT